MQKDILQTFGKHMKMIIFKCLPEKKSEISVYGQTQTNVKKTFTEQIISGGGGGVTTIFKDYPVSIT